MGPSRPNSIAITNKSNAEDIGIKIVTNKSNAEDIGIR